MESIYYWSTVAQLNVVSRYSSKWHEPKGKVTYVIGPYIYILLYTGQIRNFALWQNAFLNIENIIILFYFINSNMKFYLQFISNIFLIYLSNKLKYLQLIIIGKRSRNRIFATGALHRSAVETVTRRLLNLWVGTNLVIFSIVSIVVSSPSQICSYFSLV